MEDVVRMWVVEMCVLILIVVGFIVILDSVERRNREVEMELRQENLEQYYRIKDQQQYIERLLEELDALETEGKGMGAEDGGTEAE